MLLDDLTAGRIDIAFVYSLPPNGAVWFNPVLLDGVVLLVHEENPVTAVTRQEAQALFAGRIQNWSQLGGLDEAVVLHNRENGAGARAVFQQRVMAAQRLAITAVTETSEGGMRAAVAGNSAAVGYGMMGYGGDEGGRPLLLEGVMAEPNMVGTQRYLLTTPLYAAVDGEPQGGARALIGWLQSEAVQAELGVAYGRVR